MESVKVKELVKEIKENLSQTSSSQKDEVRVMRAMLNDRDYKVDVYGKDGVEGQFCPAESVRGMVAGVMSSSAKIPQAEAEKLVDGYEFKKNDSAVMVEVSKEFVNTFLQTGRKLPLGGREHSNVSLSLKQVEAGPRPYPVKVGVNSDGKPRYDRAETFVPAYESVRVHAPCPVWVENKKK